MMMKTFIVVLRRRVIVINITATTTIIIANLVIDPGNQPLEEVPHPRDMLHFLVEAVYREPSQ